MEETEAAAETQDAEVLSPRLQTVAPGPGLGSRAAAGGARWPDGGKREGKRPGRVGPAPGSPTSPRGVSAAGPGGVLRPGPQPHARPALPAGSRAAEGRAARTGARPSPTPREEGPVPVPPRAPAPHPGSRLPPTPPQLHASCAGAEDPGRRAPPLSGGAAAGREGGRGAGRGPGAGVRGSGVPGLTPPAKRTFCPPRSARSPASLPLPRPPPVSALPAARPAPRSPAGAAGARARELSGRRVLRASSAPPPRTGAAWPAPPV